MVSKAAIGIALLVFVLMAGISIVLGMQLLGGGGPSAAETTQQPDGGGNGNSGSNGQTTVPTATTTQSVPTVTANATTTKVNRTTPIPVSSFNETLIERLAEKAIDQKRQNRGLDGLINSGTTVRTMRKMSQNQSDNMAAVGDIDHTINGQSMVDRYEYYNLDGTCKWKAEGKNFVRKPHDANFEAIGRVVAGREYTTLTGKTRFNRNESQVADAIADYWFRLDTYKKRLSYPGATYLSVGVNITDDGDVYATAHVC